MAFTINASKETATPRKPILLVDLTFSDASVLRLATVACTYNGNAYEPALVEQNLDRLAFLSEQGIDRIPSASVQIADPDGVIYTAWERATGKGFRGATIVLRFVLYDLVTAEWSTDSIIPFVGVCEQPSVDEKGMTVQAQNALNLAALQLPIIPISARCPWINPATTLQRAAASDSNSRFYKCGETRDLATAPPCAYTRQTCTQPARFGGCTWTPAKSGEGRQYINSGDKISWTNPDTSGRYRRYWPQWLGGAAWVDVDPLAPWADGNFSRSEVAIGVGVIDVLRVVVNGIELSQSNSGDYRWHYVNHGTRDGAHNTDVGYSTGDPYGNLTVIQVLAPHSVIEPGSTPSVRVLGRKATASANISVVSASGNGTGPIRINFGRLMGTSDPGDGTLVRIEGNSWAAVNGSYILRYLDLPYDHAYLEGTQATGSGTGGTLYYASSTLGSGGGVPTPWVLQETMKACGRFSDASFGTSWSPAAVLCEHAIPYTDGDGNAASQMRFSSSVALVERRSVADIVRGLRSSIGARVFIGSNGKLEISIEGPLAEQQSAAVDGSNYNTAISSTLRDGTTANGYAAYKFDQSNSWGVKRTVAGSNSTTPNKVSFPFSDPAADWAVSTFAAVDPEDVSRMDQEAPGGLQVQPEGVASYNHAFRIARLGLAKVLRGNPRGDTRGTDWWEWQSSFRGVRVSVGQIVLLSDPVLIPTPQLVRITGVKPSKNYETITFTGHHHEDSWYADTPATLANPERTFYHYAPPTGTGGTRLVTASGNQLASDSLVLFDTAGITGYTTTLGAAMTDTTTEAFTVASGANLRNGIYVLIGSEKIGPIVGSGTSWSGPRGALGTTKATHSNGATVNIGGALAFQLLAIADWPDHSLLLRKTTTDVNYVKVLAANGNTFPGGATEFLLPSNQVDDGTSSLRSPDKGSTEWVVLAGAGKAGPPGPPGAAGVGVPAPNVLSATCTLTAKTVDHGQDLMAEIPATLDTGNTDYAHDKAFTAYAVDPDGNERFISRIGSWSGSSVTFKGFFCRQPMAGVTQTWTARIYAENEQGAKTNPPYTIPNITVAGPSIQGLAGTDSTADRWVDANRSVFAPQSVAYTGPAMCITLWRNDGINHMEGWFTVTGNTTWKIGLKGSKEIIYAPPATQTQYLKAAPGAWEGSDADGWRCPDLGLGPRAIGTIPGLYTSAGYSVAGMAKPGASEITSLTIPGGAGGNFPYNRVSADGEQYWSIDSITYDDSGCGINSAFTILTCQDYDASNNPIGPEHIYGVRPVGGGVNQNWGNLIGPYGTVASPARTGSLAKVGIRQYNVSRKNSGDDSWQDATCSTLQTSIGSGGLTLVTVAVGGAVPSGKIPTARLDAATIDPSLVVDQATGKFRVNTRNLSNLLLDGDFDDSSMSAWSKLNGTEIGWQSSGFSPSGSYVMDAMVSSGGFTQGNVACVPGQEFFCYTRLNAGFGTVSGSAFLSLTFKDSSGNIVSDPNNPKYDALALSSGMGWTDLKVAGAVAPAGSATLSVAVQLGTASGTGFWYIDSVRLTSPTAAGDGLQRDTTTGGVKFKPGRGQKIADDGSVELDLGGGLGYDLNGKPIVKTDNGLALNVNGAVVPNFGATVGVNAQGQIVVPQSSLGLAEFGGVYQPYAIYYGLPAITASVPKMIINSSTAPWSVWRQDNGVWRAVLDTRDVVAGNVVATISLTSPTISGGSIIGSSHTVTVGNTTVTISASAVDGSPGVTVRDGSNNSKVDITNGVVRIAPISGSYPYTLISQGVIYLANASGTLKTITATS